jgi:probable F420-dependent oxidoreductase
MTGMIREDDRSSVSGSKAEPASLGVYVPTMDSPDSLDAQAALSVAIRAEQLGFDSVWVGDHVQWRTAVLEPLSMLAALAVSTQRVRIGSSVLLLPLRHPVHVAKSLATIDHLSGGRLTAGFGIGTTTGNDFAAVGSNPRTRGKSLDAAITAIRALLQGEVVTMESEGWRMQQAELHPLPMQQRLPFFFGGKSDAALRRVSQFGDGWIASFVKPERLAPATIRLGEMCEEVGRTNAPEVLVLLYVGIGRSVQEAIHGADRYMQSQYGVSAQAVASASAFGPRAVLEEKLTRFQEAGATGFIFAFANGADASTLTSVAEATGLSRD